MSRQQLTSPGHLSRPDDLLEHLTPLEQFLLLLRQYYGLGKVCTTPAETVADAWFFK
jgi:hypothetical protein